MREGVGEQGGSRREEGSQDRNGGRRHRDLVIMVREGERKIETKT